MKYLDSFKVRMLKSKDMKTQIKKLDDDLYKESDILKKLIVRILDDIGKKIIYINSDYGNKTYTKITHIIDPKMMYNSNNSNFHDDGADTLITIKDNSKQIKDDVSLWNFLAGGNRRYDDIAFILDFLIDNYAENYSKVLMMDDVKKYNL